MARVIMAFDVTEEEAAAIIEAAAHVLPTYEGYDAAKALEDTMWMGNRAAERGEPSGAGYFAIRSEKSRKLGGPTFKIVKEEK